MRTFSVCFLIFAVISMPLFSSDADQEFTRQQLSIEHKTGIFGAWTKYGGSVSTFSQVRYYQGFSKITETEFLIIAGYAEEAMQAEKHRRTNQALNILSWSILGASLVTAGVGIAFRETDAFRPLLYGAMVIDLLALIPAVILMTRDNNWMPLQQASSIASDYNKKLIASLTKISN